MKLELKNIGGFKDANIVINGITIIAGNNNTGKSTIGKTLCFVFNSYYDLNNKITEYRYNALVDLFEDIFRYVLNKRPVELAVNATLEKYDELEKNISSIEEWFKSLCKDTILPNLDLINYHKKDGFDSDIELIENLDFSDVAKRISDYLSLTDEDYVKNQLQRKLIDIFKGEISNVKVQDKASIINLTIRDSNFKIDILDNTISKISKLYGLLREAPYIDNPFTLNELGNSEAKKPIMFERFSDIKYTKSQSLEEHLVELLNRPEKENPSDKMIMKKRLVEIFKKLESIELGNLVPREYIYKYKDFNNDEFSLVNTSTGLKVFLIIKTLLLNGSIQEKGTLILDEPEIHLHPEWQLVFAEIIVLLQKEFGLHILLTTHSPYFLKAIKRYSEVHNIEEKCNYYLTDCVDSICTIKDVTKDISPIQEKFFEPFQALERV